MFLFTIIISCFIGYFCWHIYIEQVANENVKIPPSSNITYNHIAPTLTDSQQISTFIEQNQDKPILLYIYTTWCGICHRNLNIINAVAQEMQNTNLKVLALVIDKQISSLELQKYHNTHSQSLYFQPSILENREGFLDLLSKYNIDFAGSVPYVAILGANGKKAFSYSGIKDIAYLRSKIIKQLYLINK